MAVRRSVQGADTGIEYVRKKFSKKHVQGEETGSAIRRLLEKSKRNEGGLAKVSSGVNRYFWDARIVTYENQVM